jgi:hypothetical protein
MVKRVVLFPLLIVLLGAIFTSPDEWLERGFDVRDGKLKEFPGYAV